MSSRWTRWIGLIAAASLGATAIVLVDETRAPAKPQYLLGPEDVVEIFVWEHGDLVQRVEPEYEIGPGDRLEIAVWPQADSSRTVTVRPDGTVSFPPYGELSAAGLTPRSLAARVLELLRAHLKDPRVTVTVAGLKVGRTPVLEVFGRVRTATVRFDGKIGLPVLGDLEVEGLTPQQVADRIAQGLAAYVRAPKVSVVVKEFKGKKVSVLGQVASPGHFKLPEPARLVEAIAVAGGPTFAARLKNVVVLTGVPDAPRTVSVDLERVLRGQDPQSNIVLQPNDVVFIPGTLEEAVEALSKKAPGIQVQVQVPGR